MTPAERLLAAADLLDKRASEATGGPWRVGDCHKGSYDFGPPWDGSRVLTEEAWEIADADGTVVSVETDRDYQPLPQGGVGRAADARYIAMMSPDKGRLIAEALRIEGEFYDERSSSHLLVALADPVLASEQEQVESPE